MGVRALLMQRIQGGDFGAKAAQTDRERKKVDCDTLLPLRTMKQIVLIVHDKLSK